MWPGLVGKGSPGAEPAIDLDTMLELTARAQVDGVKFDGVDIFLFDPHISIDISDEDLKAVIEKIAARGFLVGSVVAPVWPPTGGGSAMGSLDDRKKFVQQVRKACRIAATLRRAGLRPNGIVRIDSACSVDEWSKDPENNTRLIAQTFREAAAVAQSFGERLAAEGEICWGGMHSWREMVNLLEETDRPQTVGFQADMAHTLLYTLGYNAEPEDRLVPEMFDWEPASLDEALRELTVNLRPWTFDFHVAQNDATVHGSGTHDKTGRHCLVNAPGGKLNIPHHAGFWLRDEHDRLTRATRHICWDGCMFPNDVMMNPQTWNDILAAMIDVRDLHGWNEEAVEPVSVVTMAAIEIRTQRPAPPAKKPASKSRPVAKKTAQPRPKSKAKPVAKKKPAKKVARLMTKTRPKAKGKAKSAARKLPVQAKAKKSAKKPARKSKARRK